MDFSLSEDLLGISHISRLNDYYCYMYVTGNNLLAVVRAIADSPLLADPAEYCHGHVIYFDFVGLFMIILPVRLGTIIDVSAIVIMMLRFASKLMRPGHGKCCKLFVYRLQSFSRVI